MVEPSTKKKALEVCSREKIDAIVASHDPLATLEIASELSSKFKIPWIADLRDSWNVQTLSSTSKTENNSSLRKRIL